VKAATAVRAAIVAIVIGAADATVIVAHAARAVAAVATEDLAMTVDLGARAVGIAVHAVSAKAVMICRRAKSRSLLRHSSPATTPIKLVGPLPRAGERATQ